MSADPQSSFNPTFETNWTEDVLSFYKCASNIIGNAVGKSHLKPSYDQFKKEFDAIINVEIVKCRKIDDAKEMETYV